ncbi:DUF4129 domain-containing protein [Luteolibacter flavescens]|uniref:DUF4129 domain-containing protein n=1 Tax=Luteolibacter flavescens TaxID=1859460 RepID=A0ABT3FRQ8_9BACT|nr:DUF4129 domain-containing protein [Luteolibacter flavescens]MCW1886276.1 DUF4129 domain-containing protein [Luteolibacter flavescens]
MTAELRPRSDWEAVDLGIALSRRDFWRLLACWWLGMLPPLVLSLVFLRDLPLLMLLLCWWWMPVSSRLVLFVMSRRLFGELPGWRAILREWPRACVRRFFYRMLWARLSPWRPLTMAVEDLEGLRKKDYATRVRILLRRGDATVVVLALWRAFLTAWLAVAVFATALMFLPSTEAEVWNLAMKEWSGNSWAGLPQGLLWTGVSAVMLAMSLVDVFGTGAGFGIYVNHRTWIEGWDVELAFRRLGNRLRGVAGAVMTLLVFFAISPRSMADGTPKEVISDVKAHPDFEVFKHTWKERTPSGSSGGWSGPGDWFAMLISGIGWTLLGLLIAFFVWMIWRYRHVFKGAGISLQKPVPAAARVVMGMDVAPESLPKDIPTAAMELWRVGRRHEAMSLLYRGTISRLIETGGVEIAESDTESDCLRRVEAEAAAHSGYFGGLTDAWMTLAYGRRAPQDERMQELCATWPFSSERRPA